MKQNKPRVQLTLLEVIIIVAMAMSLVGVVFWIDSLW